jgi:putative salt-induced outer membrane protein YdiY
MLRLNKHSRSILRKFTIYLSFILFLFPKYSIAGKLKPKLGITVVESSGNVNSISTNLNGEILYEQESSSQVLTCGLRYAETEEVKSANSSFVKFKNTNNLTDEVLYLYQSTELAGDQFKRYNYWIQFNGGIGLKYKVDTDEIRAETGPGFIYEDTDTEDKGFPSYRSFVKYIYQFSDRISGSSYVEHVRDLDEVNNHRTKWLTEATIQLTEGFSLRTSREFSYNNRPPKGARMHDWITGLTLVMNF